MFLITSAAFISGELSAEFGDIPPSFLPLQNKRLFEHQLKILGKKEDIILSLPEEFTIPEIDLIYLNSRNVKVVYVPKGLSLGQSIVHVLNTTANYYDPLRILHGDTLFTRIPDDLDVYSISKPSDNYTWAIAIDKQDFVYSGYFSFSDQSLFLQILTEANYDFVEALYLYKKRHNITELILDGWFDFGHAKTYYRSKAKMTTQRNFNNLTIDGFSVKKFSKDINKISAESDWFKTLPKHLKKYLPNLWDFWIEKDEGYYQVEYLYLSTLSELFTFGKNSMFIWEKIFEACNDFLMDCSGHLSDNDGLTEVSYKLYGHKTSERLLKYSLGNGLNLNARWVLNGIETPSLNEILDEINILISKPTREDLTIVHGDFCTSNIFYNFRTHSIKVIDPRGIDAIGNKTVFGDNRYDMAKLSHSIIGLYDFIIAGRFIYSENSTYDINFKIPINNNTLEIQELYKKKKILGKSISEHLTYPILIHLFLSMLPLHFDTPLKQKAMLANALRLYIEFKNIDN
jgi:hypothetical protein